MIKHIIEPAYQLTIVSSTVLEARHKLKEQTFDLIMIEVHFHESRMFELLSYIREIRKYDNTPVICFCVRDTPIMRAMHENINIASKAMGAWVYLHQDEFKNTQEYKQEMQRTLKSCVTSKNWQKTHAKRIDIHNQREKLLQLRLLFEDKEWTLDLEERVAIIRHKLSELLLELSEAQIDSIEQQETMAKSKHFKKSIPAILHNDLLEGEERQIQRQESEQLAKEQKVALNEEVKAKEGRRRLSSDEIERYP